ncbi:MAG: ABC transporter six-transmembrane domain-containing protein [Bacteroidota bacterium]|nr:ABC transporter six-transmembrane domain-containing protein [Bacteroidota bacterium]MDP4233714.1 ABC transporter six-transmembrane domain-containing protein [Bacteroidota bacterium]MDP4242353.1 ABC transporter six-transmembrane domain-containing protein [Bacteroidota bacterium]MDP4288694.1 ABC transporter six-transmembrane domain-containing protein [Bacteroidota bacterium]
MIRRLYKEYRLQIGFAFLLVVFENVAYIAEPYVFGKAIDGLREAHRVEEEVDSSMTGLQLRQVADSVRQHVLDSLRILDSIRQRDSAAISGLQEHALFHYAAYRTDPADLAYASYRFIAHKKARADTVEVQLPPVGTPERATIDSMKRVLAKRDSIRSRRRHSLLKMPREAARDSLRREFKASKSPGPGKPAGTQPPTNDRPLSFYVTREVGPFIPPLIPWIVLFLVNSSLGAFRRLYDTRIYTRMFANLSSDVVARQLAQGEDLSKVAARSSMAWHNIEFFQYNVPEFLEQLIAVGGAVIALGLFDWRLTLVGSILIVLVLIGSRYYMRALQRIQSKLHDWYEEEYNIFSTREPGKIRQYYSDISELEIKYSTRSTFSYSVIRVFLLFMFLTTLYISIDLDRFTIGALYSIVAYVWSFVTATEYIPYLSEKWVELKDASRRITDTVPVEAA